MNKEQISQMVESARGVCELEHRKITERKFNREGLLISARGTVRDEKTVDEFVENYEYKNNQLYKIELKRKGSGTENITIYDAQRNIISENSKYAKSSEIILYDKKSRVVEKSVFFQNGELKANIKIVYGDNNNRIETIIFPVENKKQVIAIENEKISSIKTFRIKSSELESIEKFDAEYNGRIVNRSLIRYNNGHIMKIEIEDNEDIYEEIYNNEKLSKVKSTTKTILGNKTQVKDSEGNIIEIIMYDKFSNVETSYQYVDGQLISIVESHSPFEIKKGTIKKKLFYSIKNNKKDSIIKVEDYTYNGKQYLLTQSNLYNQMANKNVYQYYEGTNIIASIHSEYCYDESSDVKYLDKDTTYSRQRNMIEERITSRYNDRKEIVIKTFDKNGKSEETKEVHFINEESVTIIEG